MKEVALLSPEVRREPALVDDLLDADFQEIGASGRLWTQAAMNAALAGDIDDEQFTIEYSDMSGAVVAPNLVLLTYLTDHHGRRARRSSLWRRTGDVWQLLHHQGTPTEGVGPEGQLLLVSLVQRSDGRHGWCIECGVQPHICRFLCKAPFCRVVQAAPGCRVARLVDDWPFH